MSELTELIAKYSDAIGADETPLQFCQRVSSNGHSKLELAVLLRDLFELGLPDCSLILDNVDANNSGRGITHYIADAKRMLQRNKCPNDLTRLHLLGFISGSEVVNAIYECYHDDADAMIVVVSRLKNNVDNDFGGIVEQLESLRNTDGAG